MALVAHWPLDGKLDDISGNGYHLTNHGAIPEMNEDRFCYRFDGGDDFMELETHRVRDIMSSKKGFSYGGYLKLSDYASETKKCIISDYTSSSGDNNFMFWLLKEGSWFKGNTRMPDSDNYRNIEPRGPGWFHIFAVVSFDTEASKMSMRYFVNGIYKCSREVSLAVFENNSPPEIADTGKIKIGAIFYQNRYAEFFNGWISDIRIYDHSLTDSEVLDIYNAPLIDLDFKGAMPPTSNWLDEVIKVGTYGPSNNGGYVTILDPNRVRLKKATSTENSIYFRPLYKDFTLSFKLRVIAGVLKRIGGHCKPNGSVNIPTEVHSIYLNELKGLFNWHSGIILDREYNPGDILDVVVVVHLTEIPVWDNYGIFIQPNRNITDMIECEIFDLQIEEQPYSTDFTPNARTTFTIPDKSDYRDAIIVEQDQSIYPTITRERTFKKGSSWCLEFKNSERIQTDILHPKVFTTFILFKAIRGVGGIKSIYGAYIPNESNRLLLFVSSSNNITIRFGSLETRLSDTVITDDEEYLVTLIYDGITLKMMIDGVETNKATHSVIVSNTPIHIGRYLSPDLGHGSITINDFKLFPYAMSSEEVETVYSQMISKTLSFRSMFQNLENNVNNIPSIWLNHPNATGIDAFAGNINAPNFDKVPLGWGGLYKPDQGTLKTSSLLDQFTFPKITTVFFDPLMLNSESLTIMEAETTSNGIVYTELEKI